MVVLNPTLASPTVALHQTGHAERAGRSERSERAARAPPVFQRLARPPAYKAVSSTIEQSILSGLLAEGAPLPAEQDLAEQFGVNRSTVREAIRQLEQEGLLERRAGRRLFVTIPGIFDLAPRAARALILQQVTFRELWQLAMVIEPQAARIAAANATSQEVEQINANIAAASEDFTSWQSANQARAKPRDMARQAELDVAFHALIGLATHNRALQLAREPISLMYRPALAQLFSSLPQAEMRNLEAHRRIAAAIAARDADTAELWLRKHLIDFERGYAVAGIAMDVPLEQPRHV